MTSTDPDTISPLTDGNWPDEIADLREGFAGALNVYRTMAHHPELLRAWAPLRQHIVKDSTLGAQNSEIVILRTGVRLGSSYEWAHHVSRARALGMDDDRIKAVLATPEGDDALLAQAVDAIIDHQKLPAALERRLAEVFGQKAVFDIIATVGFYTVLGTILMTYDVPVDDKIAAEIEANPL
ncbi:carboxymuconolactone decarboxylase [Celeribacter ethanolicus]|uniref:Carboxymuconolactone decarboxylase n=1 Tax=Celeribacter ethanolicus TaxID=1758178 RepID=A0A291GFR2_9RHOB|nr:carboxymuconolactone decarboxylase family protein [Celeribacter ethanolicus]ATG48854.1 carboxymuconolactone decarboxylase [Celeribacter ethanolicus]TNE65180.1 MAG: carboxymuconolactone decarboxylase family protein [Paracoccaceae bacterium]